MAIAATAAGLAVASPVPPAAVAASPVALAAPSVTQSAQARPPALAGRVVHGGGGVPEGADRPGVPAATVELHRVTADEGAIVDSVVTSDDGSFRFALSDDEERPIFLVAARHQGVRYFGPAMHAGMESEGPYEVAVYDTTAVSAPPSDLRVTVRHVVVTRGPAGGLDVAEVIDIVGPPDRTLVAASDTLTLWSTALPEDAAHFQELEGRMPTGGVEFIDGRARLRSMLPPAGVRLSYTYRVRGETLKLPIEHPTARVELVVAGAEAEVRGAAHAETSTRAGRLMHRYEGASLESGETLEVRLVRSGGATDRWVWIWAAVGVGLLTAAGALWYTGRSTFPSS